MIPPLLVCRCAFRDDVIPPATRAGLEDALRGKAVLFVDDLCAQVAGRAAWLQDIAAQDSPVVIACQPRAVRALFDAADAPLPDAARLHNARTSTPGEILQALGDIPDASEDTPAPIQTEDAWHPWFPVIDRARCTNCRQCLNFCLFGTYTPAADGTVRVTAPRACKTNCPACARICPHVAIIFPKYNLAPIHGGEVDDAAEAERIRVDTEAILGADPYAALRQRQARRGLLSEGTRREQEAKAHAEREAWRNREGSA